MLGLQQRKLPRKSIHSQFEYQSTNPIHRNAQAEHQQGFIDSSPIASCYLVARVNFSDEALPFMAGGAGPYGLCTHGVHALYIATLLTCMLSTSHVRARLPLYACTCSDLKYLN